MCPSKKLFSFLRKGVWLSLGTQERPESEGHKTDDGITCQGEKKRTLLEKERLKSVLSLIERKDNHTLARP